MSFLSPTANQDKKPIDHRMQLHDGKKLETSIVVKAAPEDVYRVWRDIENLPQIFPYLKLVEVKSATCSRWVLQPPPGPKMIQWDSEIIEDIPGEMISWKTVGDSDIQHSGSVWFQQLPFDQGCAVRLHVIYALGEGPWEILLEKLIENKSAEALLHGGLEHLKDFFEAPEV